MKAVVCAVVALLLHMGSPIHAQDIESKLSGNTNSQGFTVKNNSSTPLLTIRGDGDVGIGTTNPEFKLTLDNDGGILAFGRLGSGKTLSTSGSGARLMWYPKKAAFRVGWVVNTQWNEVNIGAYSVATGSSTTASGSASVAIGAATIASGDYSTAMGAFTTASGDQSTSMGHGTVASGNESSAMGHYTTASGNRSTAMGSKVSTNGKEGCFMIGDASTATTKSATTTNRFYARFNNGYILYTKSNLSTGIYAFNGSTSWSSVSDSTLKENYRAADADVFLRRFRDLRLGSWNYMRDNQRHYGPMAQEWFSAFGSDGIGTIGNDTTLASADVDGVLCIAIKALEQRTVDLNNQLEAKDREITRLQEQLTAMQHENDDRYTALERLVRDLQQNQQQQPHRHVHVQLIRTEENR